MNKVRAASVTVAAAVFATAPGQAGARQASSRCDVPARDVVTHVSVDGNPFTPIPSADGCFVFVTISRPNAGAQGGVTVLSRAGGKVSVLGKFPVKGNPTGAVLTHDGSLFIVTTGDGIAFLDASRLASGRGNPELGYLEIGGGSGTIFANVTPDDRYLFVSEERARGIAVVDLEKARANHYRSGSIIGLIPTGNAPIALTFSKDGRFLYTTSQTAPSRLNWPTVCVPEGQDPRTVVPNHAKGAVLVVDVAQAVADPAHAVASAIEAGCNPVRLALSPDGGTLYATARGDNSLLAFDASKLASDSAHARTGLVPVGSSPVGVAVFGDGARVVVTNSNRFGQDANEPQWLTVVDAARLADAGAAVLGTVPTGAFPRELRVTADGKTLLVTNFLSKTVEFIDLDRLQLGPVRR